MGKRMGWGRGKGERYLDRVFLAFWAIEMEGVVGRRKEGRWIFLCFRDMEGWAVVVFGLGMYILGEGGARCCRFVELVG